MTPSRVEVFTVPLMELVTARPTRTLDGMETVADPRRVHASPSREGHSEKRRSGAHELEPVGSRHDRTRSRASGAPGRARRWKANPFEGVSSIAA